MDDLIVIGGSFAGLAGALQLVRARRKVTVLDTASPRNRFAPHSHGLLGHDHKPPLDILAEAHAQLDRYPTLNRVRARARKLSGKLDDFTVETDDGQVFKARRVLLAYGVTDQMPDIPGFADCWGKSVVPCPYCDGFEVAGKHWGLLWAGPHAEHAVTLFLDWTDRLTIFANGHDIPQDKRDVFAQRGVNVVDGQVTDLAHTHGHIETVNLDNGQKIAVDVLFAHPRNRPSSNLHETLGIETEDNPVGTTIKVTEHQTNIPGIFAAGDLANPMASVTLATSQGAMAAIFAQRSMIFGQ